MRTGLKNHTFLTALGVKRELSGTLSFDIVELPSVFKYSSLLDPQYCSLNLLIFLLPFLLFQWTSHSVLYTLEAEQLVGFDITGMFHLRTAASDLNSE